MSERPMQSQNGDAKKEPPVIRLARIVSRGWSSKTNGDVEYAITWELLVGPLEGRRVRHKLGFGVNQAKWSWKALRQLGFRSDDLADLDAAKIEPRHEISLETSSRTVDGRDGGPPKTYTNVDVRIVDFISKPPGASVLATLSKRTAGDRAAIDREFGVTAPTGQREPGDDDDDAPADDPFS